MGSAISMVSQRASKAFPHFARRLTGLATPSARTPVPAPNPLTGGPPGAAFSLAEL